MNTTTNTAQPEWTQELFTEFLDAFANEAELEEGEADDQWAGFSRQLSDSERLATEARGFDSGAEMGAEFLKMYPIAERGGDE